MKDLIDDSHRVDSTAADSVQRLVILVDVDLSKRRVCYLINIQQLPIMSFFESESSDTEQPDYQLVKLHHLTINELRN